MMLQFGSVPVLIASSVEAASQIMKTQDMGFANKPKSSIPSKLFFGPKDVAFTPYGEYWRNARSVCMLQLLNNKRVQSFSKIREEETSLLLQKIRDSIDNSQVVDLTELFVSMTNDVLCRVALGRKYCDGEEGKKFKTLVIELVELLGVFNIGDYMPWLAWVNRFNGLNAKVDKVADEFNAFLEGVIKEHKEKKIDDKEEGAADFVDILLQVQQENKSGFKVEMDSIKAIIMDIKPVLVASSVEAARAIMKTHDLDMAFSPYGEYWRQIRSVMVLHLLSNKRVQSYRHVREEPSKMIEKIRQECDSSSSVIDLRDHLCSITSNIISRVTLHEFGELLGTFNVGYYIPWLEWVNKITGLDIKVEKVAKELDTFLESVIEEHINKDFVDVLLEIQNGKETGFPLQRDSLKALILDTCAGGTDTTYAALEWIMTELLRHPRAMEKLQDEVRGITQGKAEITEDDLGNMQDPLSWENPEYRPERFLNSKIDVKGLNFELIPFGAGRRGCPGAAFAVVINELALARLVHKFSVALPEGITPENLDMTEASGITIRREPPLLAVTTPRTSYADH
ncbi:hypothetical protein K7X08_024631 [Anisodus acutangulus]|uniref:Uncharacterized protein n=1 Tax=Anisodus acutangulus TaxID=402998 RepID=A0A9Q1M974_9SOLA|nr:hypothetical protein K7X08_024631 [Anisodus acutangulus]